jgi:hypothetical protein
MRSTAALVCSYALASGACQLELKPKPPVEGVAIAVVFSGLYYWLGNEQFDEPHMDLNPGAFQHLRVAIDTAFAELPPFSESAVVAYSLDARVIVPMGPFQSGTSRTLGEQRNYVGNVVSDLPRGIEVGLEELAHSKLKRRVLVVIGDGTVSNYDAAPAQLATLRELAVKRNIETYAINWASKYSERSIIDKWTDRAITVAQPIEIPAQLRAIARELSAAKKHTALTEESR